jgi:hypothetical protein
MTTKQASIFATDEIDGQSKEAIIAFGGRVEGVVTSICAGSHQALMGTTLVKLPDNAKVSDGPYNHTYTIELSLNNKVVYLELSMDSTLRTELTYGSEEIYG